MWVYSKHIKRISHDRMLLSKQFLHNETLPKSNLCVGFMANTSRRWVLTGCCGANTFPLQWSTEVTHTPTQATYIHVARTPTCIHVSLLNVHVRSYPVVRHEGSSLSRVSNFESISYYILHCVKVRLCSITYYITSRILHHNYDVILRQGNLHVCVYT